MKHAEQFSEFLTCCKTQVLRRVHLAEVSLIVNPSAGDFGSIVLEFESSTFWLTSRYLSEQNGETIDEFQVSRINHLEEIQNEITENDIYKTLSFSPNEIIFVTELVDENDCFNGIEWCVGQYYLFFTVDSPIIIVHAAWDEAVRYELYPHQFGNQEYYFELRHNYVELFPEG